MKLGLHREIREWLPMWLKCPLFPVYDWVSRIRMRFKAKSVPEP